jgi:hypothetical protein
LIGKGVAKGVKEGEGKGRRGLKVRHGYMYE